MDSEFDQEECRSVGLPSEEEPEPKDQQLEQEEIAEQQYRRDHPTDERKPTQTK